VANYWTKSGKKSAQQLTDDLETAMKELNGEKVSAERLPVATP
jgi:hypothetical protein